MLHLKGKTCQLFKALKDHVKNSPEKAMVDEFRVFLLAGLTEYYDPSLIANREEGRPFDYESSEVFRILAKQTDRSLGYLPRDLYPRRALRDAELRSFLDHGPKLCSYVDWASRASLPLTVDKDVLSRCRAVAELKLYENLHASEHLAALSVYQLVDRFLKEIVAAENADFAYFHLSAHQEQLGPLIAVLLDVPMFERC